MISAPVEYQQSDSSVPHATQWLGLCLFSFFITAAVTAFADSPSATNNIVVSLPSALPDTGASIVRVFGALILVVGIFSWRCLALPQLAAFHGSKGRWSAVECAGSPFARTTPGAFISSVINNNACCWRPRLAGITRLSHLPARRWKPNPPRPQAAKMSFCRRLSTSPFPASNELFFPTSRQTHGCSGISGPGLADWDSFLLLGVCSPSIFSGRGANSTRKPTIMASV